MDNDKSTIGAWVGAALALAYIVSPLDVIPDAFPAVGWLDDFLAALIAILNLIQTYIGNISTSLASIVKLIKVGYNCYRGAYSCDISTYCYADN